MSAWRVRVDRAVCIGSGYCYGTDPEHFQRDGTKSRPVTPLAAPGELLRLAAEGCPVEAITVRDSETGTTVAPREAAGHG